MDTQPDAQEVQTEPAKAPEVPVKGTSDKTIAPKVSPVDNSLPTVDVAPIPVAQEVVAPDEPMQELPDSELPREISVGAMGGERVLLMQLLGLDVNHPFDEEAEAQIARRAPDYAGTVTKAIWRELYKEDPAYAS